MIAAKLGLVTTLTLGAVGCGSTPEPSLPAAGNVFQVEMSQQHFGTITAFVHDDAGIVVGARKATDDQRPQPPPGRAAFAHPETNTLLVFWIGGACRFGPTVTLTGSVGALTVTVRPESGGTLPPGIACNEIGLFYGIELLLIEPVQQDAVTVELVR